MKALAAFAMTGRRNAIIAALILGILPMINILSAPVVALVCLRHGASEGLKVLVWAVLPALGWMLIGEIFPFAMLIGTFALAAVLRSTGSWELTLLTTVVVGLAALAYVYLNPLFFERLHEAIDLFFEANPELQAGTYLQDPDQLIATWFGFVVMLFCALLLMLARYWQACLYNPGGFQIEFHQLRLSRKSAAILLTATVLGYVGGGYLAPLTYSLLPILLAGLGLIHGIVRIKRWPVMVLVILYFTLTLMSPYTLSFVIVMAMLDSTVDFRKKLEQQ